MSKNIDEVLNDSAFDCFDDERKGIIKNMYNEMQGKSVEVIMAVMAKYYNKIFAGRKITPQDRDAMLRVLTADMSEAEKNKLNLILKMLKM